MKLKSSTLFYFYWIIIQFAKGLNLNNVENVEYAYLTLIAMVFIFLKLIAEKYTRIEWIKMLSVMTIGFFSFIYSGRESVFLAIITIVAAKGVNIDRLLKITLFIRLPMALITIALSLFGLIDADLVYTSRDGILIARYGLGLGHSNVAQNVCFMLSMVWILIRKKEINFFDYIIIIICNVLLYHYTQSRTSLIILLSILMISVIQKKFDIVHRFRLVFIYIYPIMCFISFSLSFLYGKVQFIKYLNTIVSSRFGCGNWFLLYARLNLFGQDFSKFSIPLDNAYLHIAYEFGIVSLLLLLFASVKLFKAFYEHESITEIVVLFGYAFYAITEEFIPNILLNISLIYFAILIFRNTEKILVENRNAMSNMIFRKNV